MWANCYLWATWRRWQLLREWRALGSPQDRVPAKMARPSRLAPGVDHWVVGWWIPATCQLDEVQSFIPQDKRPLHWWQLWRVALFLGRVKHGDIPSSH
jgi:hypothetical protein